MWEWFADKFIPVLKNLFTVWFTGLFSIITGVAKVIILFWGFVLTMIVLFVWSVTKIIELANQIDLAAIGKPAATMITYFAFLDRFIPLTEAFAGTVLIFNLWVAVVTLRWVKSFVPTISN